MAVGTIHEWRARAACRGPATELFFAPTVAERKEDRQHREAKAKAICGQCPVRVDCLDYALGLREAHGIWGGLTEGERRLLADAATN